MYAGACRSDLIMRFLFSVTDQITIPLMRVIVICRSKKEEKARRRKLKMLYAFSLSSYTCSLKRLNPIKNIPEDTCYFWFNLVRKADDACTNHAGTLPPHGRSRKALLLSRYRKLCSLIGALHGGLWAVAVTVTS